MEEDREQPIIMPANALNVAEDEGAKSEVGSLKEEGELGKFKSVQALMEAYNNLQAEFTKRCQLLSQLQKDKGSDEVEKEDDSEEEPVKTEEPVKKEDLSSFLKNNNEAEGFLEEIQERIKTLSPQNDSPYRVAWADVVLQHLKAQDKADDPVISQYILNDENIQKAIVERYVKDIAKQKPPIVISSQGGERLSGQVPNSPTTLDEAKAMVGKMFS